MTVGARSTTTAFAGQRPVVTSTAGGGPSALAVAWLTLFAVLAALAGYVLWQRHVAEQPVYSQSLPAVAEATMPSEVVPEEAPEAAASDSVPTTAEEAGRPESLTFTERDGFGDFSALAFDHPPAAGPAEDAAPAEEATSPGETQVALTPPRIDATGLDAPWRRNAREFSVSPGQAVVAVVVAGLGLTADATEAAITMLPAEVTLSFSPYSHRLKDWIAMARIFGHEVMLDLPMEAPGAGEAIGHYGLLTAASPSENLDRLDQILERSGALVGVAGAYGQDFLGNPTALRPVLAELRARGLVFLDNAPAGHAASSALAADLRLPFAASDGKIDAGLASRRVVDTRLVQAEDLALRRGNAVVMAEGLPVSIERIATWLLGLSERGVELAPISAIARRNLARWEASG